MPVRRCAAAALLALAAACCTRAPDSPAPALALADDPAIRLFERRTEADPRDHLSATSLAEMRLRRALRTSDPADFARAEAAARTALERQPDHPAAVVALARALDGQGRTTEAVRLLDGLLDTQPRNVGALQASFDIALAAGHDQVAETLTDRLLAVNEDPGTLARLARLVAFRGDVDGAVTFLRRAADEAGDLGGLGFEIAEYRHRAGAVLADAKRADEALAEFDAALAADPEDPDALAGRAEILSARGDTQGALDSMTRAASIRPSAEFVARLGTLRNEGGSR